MQPVPSAAPAEHSPGRSRAGECGVLVCTGTAPGTASHHRLVQAKPGLVVAQPTQAAECWAWPRCHGDPRASHAGWAAATAGDCRVLCTALERCRVSSASDEAQRPRETPSYPSPALALSAHAARKKHRVNSSAWTRGPPHEASSSAPPSSRLLEGHHSVVAPRNRLSET